MSNKTFTSGDRAKRGWWASVVFMMLVVGLIIFLTYVKIVEENRDVLIGIIGMLTGSISSMLAIASGRDPSELTELRDKLASTESDKSTLIARLRDAHIQAELRTQQLAELQEALIEKLSIFAGQDIIQTKANDVVLPSKIEEWLPEPPSKVKPIKEPDPTIPPVDRSFILPRKP